MIDDSAFGALWASATECAERLRPLGHQTPCGVLQDVHLAERWDPSGDQSETSERMQGRSKDPAGSGLLVLGGSGLTSGLT